MQYIILQTDLKTITNNVVDSITDGVQWGNAVAIALTASLLAISLIKFLYDRGS